MINVNYRKLLNVEPVGIFIVQGNTFWAIYADVMERLSISSNAYTVKRHLAPSGDWCRMLIDVIMIIMWVRRKIYFRKQVV